MANIPLKSIKFPDLADTYTVPSNAGELPYNKSATYPADTVGKALQDKPDADGTIANAEQLTSNIYEEDNTPYNFRTSGGSIDIGDRETDMIVGGTVAWNQLVLDANKDYSNGESTDTRTGFYLSIQTIASPITSLVVDIVSTAKKYNKVFKTGTSALTSGIRIKHNGSVRDLNVYQNSNLSFYPSHVYFYSADFVGVDVSTADGTSIKNNQLFDLTQMFGSTIADYIYSLEQATAGAGVAWFKKLFPKPYYAYNAGELMSVQASSHDTTGFNQWDGDYEAGSIYQGTGADSSSAGYYRSKYIRVVPSATYYMNCPTTMCCFFYDENKTYVGDASLAFPYNSTFTAPPNAAYMRFRNNVANTWTPSSSDDICINLSWDGERDGEYEPYVKHSYPLDSSLTLRGIPKLDASNNLYYDGDTYEADGTVTRKYGTIDLSTQTWNYQSSWESWYTDYIADMRGTDTGTETPKFICDKYDTIATNYGLTPQDFNGITSTTRGSSGCRILVRNGSTTVAPTGHLVYELATPTTESADPYTNPQIVNDFGTEEYVDYPYSQGTRDVAIPVGHQTQYMANLKAKLEMSPNSPEGAGDYIVRQTNGENEYVTLASNATIQNIIARLEALEGQNAES